MFLNLRSLESFQGMLGCSEMVYKIVMTHLYIILGSTFIAFVGDLKGPIGFASICSPKGKFRTALSWWEAIKQSFEHQTVWIHHRKWTSKDTFFCSQPPNWSPLIPFDIVLV